MTQKGRGGRGPDKGNVPRGHYLLTMSCLDESHTELFHPSTLATCNHQLVNPAQQYLPIYVLRKPQKVHHPGISFSMAVTRLAQSY